MNDGGLVMLLITGIVFLARIFHVFTVGKIDYIEKVQRMGEDRCFPHDKAVNDFGYNPMPFDKVSRQKLWSILNFRVGKSTSSVEQKNGQKNSDFI